MRKLTCIVCPNGCGLQIEEAGGEWIVTGNRCKRGETFAIAEMTNPVRTICSTAATVFAEAPVLPVRVSGEIPKERIFDVMEEIHKIVVTERVKRGTPLIEDVLGLGVDVIATSGMLEEQGEIIQRKGEKSYE